MPNHHLNLFRFYNENETQEFLENNLSRAFAICLMNSDLFINEYIKSIISEEDYNYLFYSISKDTSINIDLQINTNDIESISYNKIYAVAMTTDKSLKMEDFFDQPVFADKSQNITDILITIKDIAIVIEVKRTGENCKAQLFNQIQVFNPDLDKGRIEPISFSWVEVIKLMEKCNNLTAINNSKSTFLSDFISLSNIRYPEWFESKPFFYLPFSQIRSTKEYYNLMKRIRFIISKSNYEILGYNDRLAISVKYHWASEVIPDFHSYNDDDKEYIVFYIWPGNTKSQGYNIFSKDLSWADKQILQIDGKEYPIEVSESIKMCHFNKYISGFNFYDIDILKQVHTKDNFYNQSGKWNIESWDEFEKFMDEHFKPEFDWRGKCGWKSYFKETDRTYFTMSLGYEVALFIPYSEFRELDKNDDNIDLAVNKINSIVDALGKLI